MGDNYKKHQFSDEDDEPDDNLSQAQYFDGVSQQISASVHDLCTKGVTVIKTRYVPGSKIYQTKLTFDHRECVYRYSGDYSNDKCESRYHAGIVEKTIAMHAQYEMVLVIGRNGKNSAVPSLVRREEADTIEKVI